MSCNDALKMDLELVNKHLQTGHLTLPTFTPTDRVVNVDRATYHSVKISYTFGKNPFVFKDKTQEIPKFQLF